MFSAAEESNPTRPEDQEKLEASVCAVARATKHAKNVRLWLEADLHPHSDLRPLYPRKRTFADFSITGLPLREVENISGILQSAKEANFTNKR